MTTTTTQLALVPRDGFFVKDGRGWHTSASGRGHKAVRFRLGRDTREGA